MSIIGDIYEEAHQKHVEAHVRAIRSLKSQTELERQTETFWTIQLSLLEMSSYTLILLFNRYQHDGMYVKNKYTKKLQQLKIFSISEEDRQCLATHLALQLCGIDA
jgi:hypothetical protein